MTRMRKLALAALTALALAAGAIAANPGSTLAGDPSQWGVAKKGSFDITEFQNGGEMARKVNEYEGQHLG
jgi:glutamine cyclotransferase